MPFGRNFSFDHGDWMTAPAVDGGRLADELGVLQAQLAPMQRREKEIKDQLKALGEKIVEGALFRCTVTQMLREQADVSEIRREMGEAWLSARSKIVVSTVVRCGAKTGAAA